MSLEEKRYERLVARLRANEPIKGQVMLDCQSKTLNDWCDKDLASGQITQQTTVRSRLMQMRNVAIHIPKPFLEYTEADYLDFFTNRCPPGSRPAYVRVIKRFERTLHNLPLGQLPPCIAWIGSTPKEENKLTPDDLVTPDEMLMLLKGAGVQLGAWLAVLWETGGRLMEVHRLLCSDVKVVVAPFNGYRVTLKGKPRSKTKGGVRTNPMAKLAPYVTAWLNVHPFIKQNPNAPLWINNKKRDGLGSMQNFPKQLHRLAKRLGIKKHITPHKFRHTKYTDMSRMNTRETTMRKHAGWSPTSPMPSRYTHLANIKNESEALRVMGIDVPPEKPVFSEINNVCSHCDTHNPIHITYCVSCSAPMDDREYMESAITHLAGTIANYSKRAVNVKDVINDLIDKLDPEEKKD